MFYAVFFSLLLLSGSISIVHAHPNLETLTVQDQNGIILNQEFGVYKKIDYESIELLSEEWINHNFVWILIGAIVVTMSIVITNMYREETIPKIVKHS